MDAQQPVVKQQYPLDNSWVHARERLAFVETRYDPGTIGHLESLETV
jgi:hypothetical protein